MIIFVLNMIGKKFHEKSIKKIFKAHTHNQLYHLIMNTKNLVNENYYYMKNMDKVIWEFIFKWDIWEKRTRNSDMK